MDDPLQSKLIYYYSHIFPAGIFTKWLTYGKELSELFEKREIAFILHDDIHLRYRSFSTPNEFFTELIRVSPEKVDIGAVYNYPPKNHKLHSDFKPVQREFVIDIDLTDYDDLRTCCKETNVCEKCWKFALAAVKILENILTVHFGFKNFIFLFSGRRGIHCWVGDECARKMTNPERLAVIGYINLTKEDVSLNGIQINYVKIHPVLEESLDIMLKSKLFDDIMVEQDWLDNEHKFVNDYFKEPVSSLLLTSFKELDGDRKLKWQFLKNFYGDLNAKDNDLFKKMFKRFILKVTYPRLDSNVSSSTNHLLKSPFCVHPKTGNIAVPLDLKNLETIKLENFPTIDKLIIEVKENTNLVPPNINNETYMKTSLGPYVKIFEEFVNKCVNS